MFKFDRMGLVFNPKNYQLPTWRMSHAQAPSTLIFDNYIRCYYSTRPSVDNEGNFVSYTGYVDLDVENPLKIIEVSQNPIMALGDRGTFDEFGVYPFSATPFQGRLLGFHGGWTRPRSVPFAVAIGASESFDNGQSFQRLGRGPLIAGNPDEPFILSGPKVRNFNDRLYLFYIAGRAWINSGDRPEPVYRIRLATSEDGENWVRENRELIPPVDETDEAQASPDVFWYGDRYHMIFCFRKTQNYRGQNGSYRLGYASSVDLLNWIRNDSLIDFEPSNYGWDHEMIAYPHVFYTEGRWFMMYLGNGVGRDGFGLCQMSFLGQTGKFL